MTIPHYVYRYYDEAGELLYVGCTVDPAMRCRGHARYSWWWGQVAMVRRTIYPSRAHALRVEAAVIRDEMPLWNVHGLDLGALGVDEVARRFLLAIKHGAPQPVARRYARAGLQDMAVAA